MSCSIVRQMDATTAFLNGDIEEVMSTIQKIKEHSVRRMKQIFCILLLPMYKYNWANFLTKILAGALP